MLCLSGPGGAGHFVKTIHNGIEYADMQMIAEIYGIMRDGLGMSPEDCAKVFKEWDKGPLDSYLIEITGHVLDAVDDESGKPLIEVILDAAGQKGTGRWSAIEALNLGVSATTIEGAVAARSISAMKGERVRGEEIYGAGVKGNATISLEALEKALLAGKIAAYAQGFAVMAKASEENGWNLPLATIAKIWRAGCIIRSRFLDQISQAFDSGGAANLLTQPAFIDMMKDSNGALVRWSPPAQSTNCPRRASHRHWLISMPIGRRGERPISPRASATSLARTGSSAWTRMVTSTTPGRA